MDESAWLKTLAVAMTWLLFASTVGATIRQVNGVSTTSPAAPATAVASPSAATGLNGLKLSDIRVRDPFIFADQDAKTYYLYAQCGNRQNQDSLGLGVEVYASKDLINWREPKLAFARPTTGFWGGHDIWAPEVHKFKDQYFMFVTFPGRKVGHGTQILRADKPEGPFTALADTASTPPEEGSLDGSPWIDPDGTHWLVYCHEWTQIKDGTVRAVPMTDDWTARKGESILLFRASDAPWVRPHTPGNYVTDGSFLYKTKSGRLQMIWSSFRKGGAYTVGVAESESGMVKGPWRHLEKPLFGDDGGHGMIFRDFSGNPILVLHQPNGGGKERAHFFNLTEEAGKLILAGAAQVPAAIANDTKIPGNIVMPENPPADWLTFHLVHPGPGRAVPGDPNCAFFWKGRYHLHYIYNDNGFNFAHVSSTDMVHWTWHPTTLTPQTMGHGMFSGTGFLTKEGKPAIIYHGVGSRRNQIAIAEDDQLEKWSKPMAVEPVIRPGQDGSLIANWDPDAWIDG